MKKWDKRLLNLAKEISFWSKDNKRQVGCVITDYDNHIISTGYNGYPIGFDDNDMRNKVLKSIHAETNALLRVFVPFKKLKMYIYGGHPCSQCAALIIQSQITDIWCSPVDLHSSWTESMLQAELMFKEIPHISYNLYTMEDLC